MKKFIAGLVVVCFLLATMPRSVAGHDGGENGLIALGIVGALIGGLVWLTGKKDVEITKSNNETQNEMHKRENEVIWSQGAYRSLGGKPGVVNISGGSLEKPITMGYNEYPPQPTTLGEARKYGFLPQQNVRPLESHKERSPTESSLYRAGQEAVQNGVRIECVTNNDYCRGYNAAMKGR